MEKVFKFLRKLASNNSRDWMNDNKSWYQQARGEFQIYVEELIAGIGRFDDGIRDLTPKDCIFRINRDIRFSKNKAPYKTNFGAAITEGGRKTGNPTYYIHIEPMKSLIAGGLYMPEAENLRKIRQEIDYNPEELKRIIDNKQFVEVFGSIRGEALKTAPKGYPKDHPNIELLRFKSYIVWADLKDDLLQPGSTGDVVKKFELIYPFNQYLAVSIS